MIDDGQNPEILMPYPHPHNLQTVAYTVIYIHRQNFSAPFFLFTSLPYDIDLLYLITYIF